MWRDDSTLDRMTAKAKITWNEREGRERGRRTEGSVAAATLQPTRPTIHFPSGCICSKTMAGISAPRDRSASDTPTVNLNFHSWDRFDETDNFWVTCTYKHGQTHTHAHLVPS